GSAGVASGVAVTSGVAETWAIGVGVASTGPGAMPRKSGISPAYEAPTAPPPPTRTSTPRIASGRRLRPPSRGAGGFFPSLPGSLPGSFAGSFAFSDFTVEAGSSIDFRSTELISRISSGGGAGAGDGAGAGGGDGATATG